MNTFKTKKLKPLREFSRLQMTLASFFLLFGKRHNTNTMFGWVKRERKCNFPLFSWSEKGRGNKMGQIEFFTLAHHLFSFQTGENRGQKMVMRRK